MADERKPRSCTATRESVSHCSSRVSPNADAFLDHRCPCLTCTVKIVQCGVKEVVYSLSYSMDEASRQVMESAGVILRQMQGVPVPV